MFCFGDGLMPEHADEVALRVFGEQQEDVAMTEAEWTAFCKALDAPPRRIPALHKLLTNVGAFDSQERPASE
jgi:uncharacterized protein (DUF1778 family)